MENVIIVLYQDEKTAYQVLSELKNRTGQSTVLQAGILQNNGGAVQVRDGWSNAEESSSWASGGLIGGLVGILGGPVGMLFGASVGMLAGSAVDADNSITQDSVVEQAAHSLQEGYLALMLVAQEDDPAELDAFFKQYGPVNIIRREVLAVQAEIYQAEEAQREAKKQAHAKMREEKKAEWKQKAQSAADKVKGDFESLKAKL